MASPPHILLFLKNFATGGVERTALRMVHEWRAMGLPVTLWLAQDAGTQRGEFRDGLDPVIAHASGLPAQIAHLSRTIGEVRPDVLFCAGNTYAIYGAAVKLRLGRECPPIAIKISNDLERRDMNGPVRWGYHRWMALQGRLFDHFIAMSDALRPEIERYARVPPARVSVIEDPSIVSVPPHPHPFSAGPGRRFVTIGRMTAQKNQRVMLRAFAKGAAPGDHLTIIGDGPLGPSLREEAQRLELGDQITFRGFVEDAMQALEEHDIFLLSSDYEGLPAAIVEALARAMPIIATRCSAAMDALLGHGALGTLVPTGDVEALATAIRAAAKVAPDMASAQAMAQRFTVAAAAQRYAELFGELAQAH